MSSTKFNIGLTESGRSSSRVLKPPGGGHSDIFGAPTDEQPKSNKKNQSSEIKGCLNFEEPIKKVIIDKEPEVQGIVQKADDNSENALPTDQKKEDIMKERVRVPPGGFSSALW